MGNSGYTLTLYYEIMKPLVGGAFGVAIANVHIQIGFYLDLMHERCYREGSHSAT